MSRNNLNSLNKKTSNKKIKTLNEAKNEHKIKISKSVNLNEAQNKIEKIKESFYLENKIEGRFNIIDSKLCSIISELVSIKSSITSLDNKFDDMNSSLEYLLLMNLSKASNLNFSIKREIDNILKGKFLMILQKIRKNNNNNLNENRININKVEEKIKNNNNSNIIPEKKDKIKKRFSFTQKVRTSKNYSNENSTSKEPLIPYQTPKTDRIIVNNEDKNQKTKINQMSEKKKSNKKLNSGLKKKAIAMKKKYYTNKDIFKPCSKVQQKNSKTFSYNTSQIQYKASKPAKKTNPFLYNYI